MKASWTMSSARAVVGHHAAHVGRDPVPVAEEERLERLVAALPSGGDELLVRRLRGCCCHQWLHRVPYLLDGLTGRGPPRATTIRIPTRKR